MTDKELRKLRRDDLLQILISQQRQIDELNAQLERAQAELEQRAIAIKESGSVAEAALRLNGVFEAAQAAADQYLAQMRDGAEREAAEAKRAADDAVRAAREEADRILREARSEAERLKAETRQDQDKARSDGAAPEAAKAPEDGDGKRRRGLLWRNRAQ